MRAAVVVSGVLGAGTALVFAAAAVVATVFPSGTLVPSGWNGGCFDCGGWGKGGIIAPAPMPVPLPVNEVPEKGLVVIPDNGPVIDVAPMPGGTDDDVLAQP